MAPRLRYGVDPYHPGQGALAAPAARSRSQPRSGRPVHLTDLQPTRPRSRRPTLDGKGGRLLRQRHGGELLRHGRMRFHRPHTFHATGHARRGLFRYMEGWYNPHRSHPGIGHCSRANFEKEYRGAACPPRRRLSTKPRQVRTASVPVSTAVIRPPAAGPFLSSVFGVVAPRALPGQRRTVERGGGFRPCRRFVGPTGACTGCGWNTSG